MASFPAEVLRLIFASLLKEELYTCMTVCKSWYPEASAKQYAKLEWSTKFTARHVQLATKTRVDGSKLGDFVRTIYFYGSDRDANLTLDNFRQLIYSLPHLRTIYIVGLDIPYLNAIALDKLTNLQEISLSHNELKQQDLDTHFLTNVRFSSQITTLKLRNVSLATLSQHYEGLLTLLTDFKVLQHFEINCYDLRGADSRKQCINVTRIINTCKSLVSLDFASKCNWIITPEANNYINADLVSLKLKLDSFREEHMLYMMQHLPNLKNFHLELANQCLEDVLNATNKSVVEKFALYLQKVTRVEIKSMKRATRGERADVVSALAQTLWDFLRKMSDRTHYYDLYAKTVETVEKFNAGAYFVKQNQNFSVYCSLLINTTNHHLLQDQLKEIVWRSIKMSVNVNKQLTYTHIYSRVINLLKQQHRKCSLNIGGLLCFNAQPLRLSKSVENYGSIQEIRLRNDLLKGLADLYPTVEDLVFERCKLEKSSNCNDTYIINLTHFTNFARLTFDLDKLIDKPRVVKINGTAVSRHFVQLVYISLIDSMSPHTFQNYAFTRNTRRFEYLGSQKQVNASSITPVVKIHFKYSGQFVFKRSQRTVAFL